MEETITLLGPEGQVSVPKRWLKGPFKEAQPPPDAPEFIHSQQYVPVVRPIRQPIYDTATITPIPYGRVGNFFYRFGTEARTAGGTERDTGMYIPTIPPITCTLDDVTTV